MGADAVGELKGLEVLKLPGFKLIEIHYLAAKGPLCFNQDVFVVLLKPCWGWSVGLKHLD